MFQAVLFTVQHSHSYCIVHLDCTVLPLFTGCQKPD